MSLSVESFQLSNRKNNENDLKFSHNCLRIYPVCRKIVRYFCALQIEEIASFIYLFFEKELDVTNPFYDRKMRKQFTFLNKNVQNLYFTDFILHELKLLSITKSVKDYSDFELLEMFKSEKYGKLFTKIRECKNLSYQKIADYLMAAISGLKLTYTSCRLGNNKFFQFYYYNQPLEQMYIYIHFDYNFSNRDASPSEIREIRKQWNMDNKISKIPEQIKKRIIYDKKYLHDFYRYNILNKEISNIFTNIYKIFKTHKISTNLLTCKISNYHFLASKFCRELNEENICICHNRNYYPHVDHEKGILHTNNQNFDIDAQTEYAPIIYSINISVRNEENIPRPFTEKKLFYSDRMIPRVLQILEFDKFPIRYRELPTGIMEDYCEYCKMNIQLSCCICDYIDHSNHPNCGDFSRMGFNNRYID